MTCARKGGSAVSLAEPPKYQQKHEMQSVGLLSRPPLHLLFSPVPSVFGCLSSSVPVQPRGSASYVPSTGQILFDIIKALCVVPASGFPAIAVGRLIVVELLALTDIWAGRV